MWCRLGLVIYTQIFMRQSDREIILNPLSIMLHIRTGTHAIGNRQKGE